MAEKLRLPSDWDGKEKLHLGHIIKAFSEVMGMREEVGFIEYCVEFNRILEIYFADNPQSDLREIALGLEELDIPYHSAFADLLIVKSFNQSE